MAAPGGSGSATLRPRLDVYVSSLHRLFKIAAESDTIWSLEHQQYEFIEMSQWLFVSYDNAKIYAVTKERKSLIYLARIQYLLYDLSNVHDC